MAKAQTAAPKAAVSHVTFPFSTIQNKKNKSAIRLSLPNRTEFRKPLASLNEFYQISHANTRERAAFASRPEIRRSCPAVFLSSCKTHHLAL
jgi:hypothetical protein